MVPLHICHLDGKAANLAGAMTIRTTKRTVNFTRPFSLEGSEEQFPEGAYVIETDEELLEGISFPVYRRILTLIHLHPERKFPGRQRTMTIDPNALDAALARDQMANELSITNNKIESAANEKDAALSKEADIRALERADDEGMISRPK